MGLRLGINDKPESVFPEGVVAVKYHITDDLVGESIPFLRADIHLVRDCFKVKPSEGIKAVYVDDQDKKVAAKSSITFNEAGEHIVQIVLEDNKVIPCYFLYGAKHIHSVEIPDSVTEIHNSAFRGTKMKCPPEFSPNLKKIEHYAFSNAFVDVDCVQLPDSTEMIGEGTFNGVPHLIVGKSFKGYLPHLSIYDEVTVPADNPFVEIRDGFVIEKATKTVECILNNAYNDSENVTIRLPDGVSGFYSDGLKSLFSSFSKAKIYIPGSVKKADIITHSKVIECAEGVKKISIRSSDITNSIYKKETEQLNLKFPSTINQLDLHGLSFDELSVPTGTVLLMSSCRFRRLNLASGVVLKARKFSGVFIHCKGEIFVEGSVTFKEWNWMEDDSVIHVPNEETAKKIITSPEFNKRVKIFIGADTLISDNESQDRKLFTLLGAPGYSYTLHPIKSFYSTPQYLTLLFNFPKKTTVSIEIENPFMTTDDYEYILDDEEQKKLRCKRLNEGNLKKIILKIVIPSGLHIVRLINRWLGEDLSNKIVIEPACETMLIPDTVSCDKFSNKTRGIKHLILGAQCKIRHSLSLPTLVTVVPENNFYKNSMPDFLNKGLKDKTL